LEAKNLKEAPTVTARVLESYTSLEGAVFLFNFEEPASFWPVEKGGL
jgi:hypothetical protein